MIESQLLFLPGRYEWPLSRLIEGFRDDPDPEYGLPRFVEQLHLPFGVFGKLSRDAARHVGADSGHLFPGCIPIGTFGALLGRAGEVAITDTKEIERHCQNR